MSREFVALAIMGIDQHENGAIAVARVLREAQMKVDYFGKFQTPDLVAEKAIKDGADVIGISCHSWEYLRLVPELIQATENTRLGYSRRYRGLRDYAGGRREDAAIGRRRCLH